MKRLIIAVAVAAFATVASANGGGDRGHRGPGPGIDDRGPGGNLIVAADGTVIVTSAATSGTTTTVTAKAINASGSTAWTVTLPAGARDLELSGNLLIAETGTDATSTAAAATTLTAISVSTGATAWTLTFDGHVADVHPFSGGTYVIVVSPAATSGATPVRTLKAIGPSGAILWSVTL
jgi:hypothetical protein